MADTFEMKPTEKIAAALVEQAIPRARMVYRCEQSNGEPDFELHLPSGLIADLEVTSVVNRQYLEVTAAIHDVTKGGVVVVTSRCQLGWYVHPGRGANIRRIRQRADELLHDVEAAGLTRFFAPIDACDHEPVERIWRELRIEGGQSWTTETPRILLAAPSQGGHVTFDSVLGAIEEAASQPDNQRKLRLSQREQRHLFVHVDSSAFLPWVALRGLEELPVTPPTLPDAVSHLWVSWWAGTEDRLRLLRYCRRGGWREVEDELTVRAINVTATAI